MCRFGFPRAKGPLIILIIFPQSTVNRHGIKFHSYWIHPTLKPNSGPQPCLFFALNRGFVGGPPFIHQDVKQQILWWFWANRCLMIAYDWSIDLARLPSIDIDITGVHQVEFSTHQPCRSNSLASRHTDSGLILLKWCLGSMPSTCHAVSLFC